MEFQYTCIRAAYSSQIIINDSNSESWLNFKQINKSRGNLMKENFFIELQGVRKWSVPFENVTVVILLNILTYFLKKVEFVLKFRRGSYF